jgi:hypothetical protein
MENAGALFKAAMEDARPEVRSDALLLLWVNNPSDGTVKVLDTLALEKDLAVVTDLTKRFAALPANESIEVFIACLSRTGLPTPYRQAALKRLKAVTKQELGLDPFPWKRWWEKSKASFTKSK